MKAPDKVLFEYAAGRVTCYHGHELTWDAFVGCCEDFFKRIYGIRSCYWRLLRANGFQEDAVRGFMALDLLSNDLDNVILDPAFKLNMFLKERLSGFVDPRNMIRFETEQEALAHMPKADFAEYLKLTDAQKEAVEKMHKRNLAKRISHLVLGQVSVEVRTAIGNNDRHIDDWKPTRGSFAKYLETLTGLPSIDSFDLVSGLPTVLSVWSEATSGKRRRFKVTLTSLASCAREEYDVKRGY